MSNILSEFTSAQLRRAITIKQRIEALQRQLQALLGSERGGVSVGRGSLGGRRTMSVAAKARIVAAQKKRWAKWRKEQAKA
jgi:hypothetical protein